MTQRANTHGKHRQRLYDEFHSICWLCLKPNAAEIDHIIPVSQGGSDEYVNLRLAHKACNVARNRRDHDFHKAPAITNAGFPTRWHHIELHPDMWRDDFKAKAKAVAAESERIRRDKEQQRNRAIRETIAELQRRIATDRAKLQKLKKSPPPLVEAEPVAGSFGTSTPWLALGKPIAVAFQVCFVILGLWAFGWRPPELMAQTGPIESLLADLIFLGLLSFPAIWAVRFLGSIWNAAKGESTEVKERQRARLAYEEYETERDRLTRSIRNAELDLQTLSPQLGRGLH